MGIAQSIQRARHGVFDKERAAISLKAFNDYFGLRPDSDLRRKTREDVVHHVEAFFV